jgi:hypothetical protein
MEITQNIFFFNFQIKLLCHISRRGEGWVSALTEEVGVAFKMVRTDLDHIMSDHRATEE